MRKVKWNVRRREVGRTVGFLDDEVPLVVPFEMTGLWAWREGAVSVGCPSGRKR